MRLVLIIFFSSLFFGLSGQDLPVDYRLKRYSVYDKSLKDVILDLTAKTGINISFVEQSIPKNKKIRLSVTNQKLGDILDVILAGTDLRYKIVGEELIIYKDTLAETKDELIISGYIRDIDTEESLIYATVASKTLNIGVESNEYGFYSLRLPKGDQDIEVSYLGYELKTFFVSLKRDTVINFDLKSNLILNEIVVTDKKSELNDEKEDAITLPLDEIRNLASLGGEADIMRMAMMQSGISSGADGYGGMNVRGGSIDQNLILLDGVPLYNANHSLGLFSVFNSSMIKSAKLYKNGIPARYSGRLSSVLDVRTKEGSMKKLKGDVSIGLIAARATLEGPIQKGKSSFIVSARRTILDPWIKLFTSLLNESSDTEGSGNYNFSDLNAKLNFKMGTRNRLHLSYYRGNDNYNREFSQFGQLDDTKFEDSQEDIFSWGNALGTLRWNMLLTDKMFGNLSVHFSQFDFQLFDKDRLQNIDSGLDTTVVLTGRLFDTHIRDLGAKMDFQYFPGPGYTMRFGAKFTRHNFSPGLVAENNFTPASIQGATLKPIDLERLLDNPNYTGYESSLYMENEFSSKGSYLLNLGFHLTSISTGSKNYLSFQPRFSLSKNISPHSYLILDYSLMNQYLHLLSNAGLGLPSDVWLPSTDFLPPQTAHQVSGGLNLAFSSSDRFKIIGFYKTMNNILSYGEGGIFSIVNEEDWEEEVPIGSGRAFGVEMDLTGNLGKLQGWANYTWSHSKRLFDEINGGTEFFSRFDRRHNVKVSGIYPFNDNAEFTFNWTFGSGVPITEPTSVYLDENSFGQTVIVQVVEGRNNSKLPAYHRLDLGFNFYNKYSWGRQKFSLGVYNAYNRSNPWYIEIQRNKVNFNVFETKHQSLLPIVPYFNYSLSF